MTAPASRAYPIRPRPDDDPRFNLGLTIDVARVLADHGYPPVKHGLDLVDLQQALFGFLYGDRDIMRSAVAEQGERPVLDPRSFDSPAQRAAARMLNDDAAPAGLTQAELDATEPGTYRCTCGHWDNVHGIACFAWDCGCTDFTPKAGERR